MRCRRTDSDYGALAAVPVRAGYRVSREDVRVASRGRERAASVPARDAAGQRPRRWQHGQSHRARREEVAPLPIDLDVGTPHPAKWWANRRRFLNRRSIAGKLSRLPDRSRASRLDRTSCRERRKHCFLDDFAYDSIFERSRSASVDKPLTPDDLSVFDAFATTNFEQVLAALKTSRTVMSALGKDAAFIKDRYESIPEGPFRRRPFSPCPVGRDLDIRAEAESDPRSADDLSLGVLPQLRPDPLLGGHV